MNLLEIQVDKIENERLDLYLSKELTEMSRTYIHKLIEEGLVLVNGKKPKPRYLVKKGDFIQVELPEPKKLELVPENIPLDIIYQDDDVLIVNKPKGMVVHPAPGNYSNTLVNALLYHVDKIGRASCRERV